MISYEDLQASITAACQEAEAIRAVILVGSRARKDRPLDEHADLDFILFTPEPEAVKTMPAWIATIASVWVPDFSYTGPGDPEWMVLYEDGYKVDYTFHKIEPGQSLQDVLAVMPYQSVLLRGFEILVDKTASRGDVSWAFDEVNRPTYPTAEQFKSTNDNFFLEAARAARFIARGDLWRAKMLCDTTLKQQLLVLVEWHSRGKNGLEYDTWYDGRYLSEWADPLVTAALPDTFATYNTADLRRAFHATLTLYHQLALETAAALDLAYPTAGQEAALGWLTSDW